MNQPKTVLVYGGSFDPPHVGHVKLLMAGMDHVRPDMTRIMPTWSSPLKDGHGATFDQRFEMVCRTLGDELCHGPAAVKYRGWMIDDLEGKRRRKTYSYDVMERMAAEFPKAKLYFLAGLDVLDEIDRWKHLKRFAKVCTLLVGVRPGVTVGVPSDYPGEIQLIPTLLRGDPMSSSNIRMLVDMGRDISTMVTFSTHGYIYDNRLYGAKVKEYKSLTGIKRAAA